MVAFDITVPLTATDGRRVLRSRTLRIGSISCDRTGGADDLVALAAKIPDRRAEHVHEAGEGEDQEDGQAENDVQLEDWVHVGDEVRRARMQRYDALRPVHELHHLMPVHVH